MNKQPLAPASVPPLQLPGAGQPFSPDSDKQTRNNAAIQSAFLAMAALNGAFLSANGVFMLVAPAVWYDFVPGVTDTGFYNQHFIRDIGLIQLFLGVAFAIGMVRAEHRIWLWSAASVWLAAHAVFHLWEVAVGICSPGVLVRDFPAVSLPALIGAMLTLWAIRHAHAGRAAFA